jgi:hypothetical protein
MKGTPTGNLCRGALSCRFFISPDGEATPTGGTLDIKTPLHGYPRGIASARNLTPPHRDRDRHYRTDNCINHIDEFVTQPVEF